MEFQTIASGSTGNCYLLHGELQGNGLRQSLMIESGVSKKTLINNRVSVSLLSGCLITHSHSDHCKGVGDLIRSGVDCYMSQGTADEIGITSHRIHIVNTGVQFKVGCWTILPFDTIHDTAEPLGFLIGYPNGDKLLFATDTGYIKYKFKGLTHIAIECNFDGDLVRRAVSGGDTSAVVAKRIYGNHMSLEAVKRMIEANDLTRVREIHLLHLSDGHSHENNFRHEVERLTGVPVYVGQSL